MKDLFEKSKDILEFQGEHRWLSNFESVEVELDGNTFASIEHAYVSAKSDDPRLLDICLNENKTSGQIKREGRKAKKEGDKGMKYLLVPNWNVRKLEVMEHLLRQKFNTEPFKSKLLATGDCYIQEGNMWNDTFFGFCLKTNKGLNHLGNLIMKIRKELVLESYLNDVSNVSELEESKRLLWQTMVLETVNRLKISNVSMDDVKEHPKWKDFETLRLRIAKAKSKILR